MFGRALNSETFSILFESRGRTVGPLFATTAQYFQFRHRNGKLVFDGNQFRNETAKTFDQIH